MTLLTISINSLFFCPDAIENYHYRFRQRGKFVNYNNVAGLCIKKLGDRDSNPDTTVQSRMSYHWTISQ